MLSSRACISSGVKNPRSFFSSSMSLWRIFASSIFASDFWPIISISSMGKYLVMDWRTNFCSWIFLALARASSKQRMLFFRSENLLLLSSRVFWSFLGRPKKLKKTLAKYYLCQQLRIQLWPDNWTLDSDSSQNRATKYLNGD